MQDEEIIKWLRIPLYKLYYIEDLSQFEGLNEQELMQWKDQYNVEEQRSIVKALGWAVNNPHYDYRSLLPNLRQSNSSIHQYIYKVYSQLSV